MGAMNDVQRKESPLPWVLVALGVVLAVLGAIGVSGDGSPAGALWLGVGVLLVAAGLIWRTVRRR